MRRPQDDDVGARVEHGPDVAFDLPLEIGTVQVRSLDVLDQPWDRLDDHPDIGAEAVEQRRQAIGAADSSRNDGADDPGSGRRDGRLDPGFDADHGDREGGAYRFR